MISIDGIEGWLIPGDINYLSTVVRSLPPAPTILEVGSWMGLSATIMARARPDAAIRCVDTWEGSAEHMGHPSLTTLFDKFKENVAPLGDRVIAYRMPSLEAAKHMEDDRFDLVFIDGDHSFDGASADIWAWEPKVKPSGVLIVHDCVDDADHPEAMVRAAVEHFCRARGYGVAYTCPPDAHYMGRVIR